MPDVSLPQLLDLSLGNPELGAVNFNQLHKLLLEIIGRLDKAGHPLSVSDVDTKRELKSAAAGNYPKSSYNTLQDKVNKIEKDITNMSTALPDAKDMISKVKTDTPLTDLWQHMQVNKKVENNEQGINTAMGLIQQLIKDMQDLKDENKAMRKKLDQIDMDDINAKLKKLDELRERMKGLTGLADKMNDLDSFKNQLDSLQKRLEYLDDELARLDGLPTGDEIVTWPGLEDALKGVRGEFAAYRPESRTRSAMETRTAPATPPPHASAPHASAPQASVPQAAVTRPSSGRVSHAESTNRPRSGKSALSEVPSVDLVDSLEGLGSINKRHEELKKRVDDLELAMENKANKDDVSGKLPDDLMQRIEDMSNKMTELSDLRTKDAESIKRAQKAMTDLQEQLEDFQRILDYLNKENDAKTKEIQKLTSETQKLKDTKADKDYVDAELDAKADKSQVDSKVNRSVFDSTIGDLQKMIDDLLSKLLAYEEAWKKAQGKLEEDIDGKIDRTELDRLKAYLDRKIKELNNKMKQNGGMFNPFCEDAAGLKKQLLPFNCLSCDKPVVVSNNNQMTQSTPGALGDAFTANKSARPYTTFELDQIRQHAKSLLNADYVMDYYSMPRAAGGSHTMTYPHKRVTKQAYKIHDANEEIPPEIFLPVRDEAEIVGADGHVYRGRFDMRSSHDQLPTQDGRPTTPNRPRTSPIKRPGSARPGSMTRPRTAVPSRVSAERPGSAQRPTSARERPVTSLGMRDYDEGGLADDAPPVVTIETVAEIDPQSMQPAPISQNSQA